jgi:hypothetical protein
MAKDGNLFVIHSEAGAAAFCRLVMELAKRNPEQRIAFSWKVGELVDRDHKAVIHIWLRQWAAFVHKKAPDDVTKDEVEGMKRWVKASFYHETAAAFMVEKFRHPLKPGKTAIEYTSIAEWYPHEFHQVMTWMHAKALNMGLILEAIGDYQDMQQQSTS